MKQAYYKTKRAGLFFTLILAMILTTFSQAQESNLFKAERRISGSARHAGEMNSITYTVLKNNQKKYAVTIPVDYDLPIPELKVFNDGSAVLVNSFDGSLTFFNTEGREVVKEFIVKELPVEYERAVYAAVSGSTLAVALSQPDLDYAIFALYNKNGRILSQWRTNEKHLSALSYSEQTQRVAVSVYGWVKDKVRNATVFYNEAGKEISRIPLGFKKGTFVDEGRLFLGFSNKTCFVYHLKDNTIRFQNSVPNDEMIINADYSNKEITIESAQKPLLKNGTWRYRNPTFTRLTLSGKMIKQWRETGEVIIR